MPIYSVQGPDGRIYDVEGPAGASEAQIIEVVKRGIAAEKKPSAPKEPTAGGQVKELFKGILPGAIGLVETAAVGASSLLPEEQERAARATVADIAGAAKRPFEAAPGYEGTIGRQIGQGLGSFLPVAPLAFLGAPGALAGVGVGLAAGAGEARQKAEQAAATAEQRGTATALGTIPGGFDVAVDMALAAFPGGAGKAIGFIKRALISGGVEGVTEAAQEIAQNAIAKGVYKPEQSLVEGAGEAGALGAGVGTLASLILDVVVPGRRGAAVPSRPERPVPEAAAPTAPPTISPVPTAEAVAPEVAEPTVREPFREVLRPGVMREPELMPELTPLEQYAKQQIALANRELRTPSNKDYLEYLLQDPATARQLVDNQVQLPGFTPRRSEGLLGALNLQLEKLDKEGRKAGKVGTLAAQQRIAGVEEEEQAALEAQRAEEERARQEAEAQSREATREEKIAPEIAGLRRLGKVQNVGISANADKMFRALVQRGLDEKTVSDLVDSLPQGESYTPLGQVVFGSGTEPVRSRRDLIAQYRLAKDLRDKQAQKEIFEELRALRIRKREGTGALTEEAAKALNEQFRIRLPENLKAEDVANKTADNKNAAVTELVNTIAFGPRRPAGTLGLGTAAEQNQQNKINGLRNQIIALHLAEIAQRKEAYGLPPMLDWERGEAQARISEAVDNLIQQGNLGGAFMPAVRSLQQQARQNLTSILNNAIDRDQRRQKTELAEKTGTPTDKFYFEDAEGRAIPGKTLEVPRRPEGPRIAAPAEIKLREQPRIPRDDRTAATNMLEQVLTTAGGRKRAVAEVVEEPATKVKELGKLKELLKPQKAGARLEAVPESTLAFARKLREELEVNNDPEFLALAREQAQRILEGNDPDAGAVRELNDMMRLREEAGRSTTRPGATEEELRRTSAQPQLSLFGEVATERATPANFQRLLDSKDVAGLKAQIAKVKADNKAALELAKVYSSSLQKDLQKALKELQTARERLQDLQEQADKTKVSYGGIRAKEGQAKLLEPSRTKNKSVTITTGFELKTETGEPDWFAPAVRTIVEYESALGSIPPRIQMLKDMQKQLRGLSKQERQDLLQLAQAAKDTELAQLLQRGALSGEIKKLTDIVNNAKANIAGARKKLDALLTEWNKNSVLREALERQTQQAAARVKRAETKVREATGKVAEERKAEEAKKEAAEEVETPEATWRASLQRGREGLNLPGLRVERDTTRMNETIANIRRAMGSLDEQIARETDPVKKAELQAKHKEQEEKLERVYADSPRITTPLKERDQLAFEKAFDDAQAGAYDKAAAQRRERKKEMAPTLPPAKFGPLAADVRTREKKQTGQRKNITERADDALKDLISAREAYGVVSDRINLRLLEDEAGLTAEMPAETIKARKEAERNDKALLQDADKRMRDAQKRMEEVAREERATYKELARYRKGIPTEEEQRFARGVEVASPDLTADQVRMLQNNDIVGALRSIAEDKNASQTNRVVAARLAAMLGATDVKLVKNLKDEKGQPALGRATSKLVELDANLGVSQEILLHEATHAAVERVLLLPEDQLTDMQRVARRELQALFNAVKNDPRITSVNAKGSLSEFAAEVMSNSNLQRQLSAKKWRLSDAWQGFKSIIMRMLGIQNPETMLGAALQSVDALMIPSSTRLQGAGRPKRVLSQKDIAALHTGSNSMRQFADQFGPLIKQKDRTPEDAERIAGEVMQEMRNDPYKYFAEPKVEKLDYVSSLRMPDGSTFDPNNLLHLAEASVETLAAYKAASNPDLQRREAERIGADREYAFTTLVDYLRHNPAYTLVEQALVAKAAGKYGVISDANGRLKLVTIEENNRHPIAVVGHEAANSIIEELRAGKSLKDAFLSGMQNIADRNAQNNTGLNGWKKFDQSDKQEAAVALNAGAAGTSWCTGASVSTAKAQIEEGDFYIHYKNGRPEVAVRMNGSNRIGEIRGNTPNQALTKEQEAIAEQFLRNTPDIIGAEDYLRELDRKKALIAYLKTPNEKTLDDLTPFFFEARKYTGNSPLSAQTVQRGFEFRSFDGYSGLRPRPPADAAQKLADVLNANAVRRIKEGHLGAVNAIFASRNTTVDVYFGSEKINVPIENIKEAKSINIILSYKSGREEQEVNLPNLERVGDFKVGTDQNTRVLLPKLKYADKIRWGDYSYHDTKTTLVVPNTAKVGFVYPSQKHGTLEIQGLVQAHEVAIQKTGTFKDIFDGLAGYKTGSLILPDLLYARKNENVKEAYATDFVATTTAVAERLLAEAKISTDVFNRPFDHKTWTELSGAQFVELSDQLAEIFSDVLEATKKYTGNSVKIEGKTVKFSDAGRVIMQRVREEMQEASAQGPADEYEFSYSNLRGFFSGYVANALEENTPAYFTEKGREYNAEFAEAVETAIEKDPKNNDFLKPYKSLIQEKFTLDAPKWVADMPPAEAQQLEVSPYEQPEEQPRYAKLNPELKRAVNVSEALIYRERPVMERLRESGSGLTFETYVVDRFAGFERLRKYMSNVKGLQMTFYLRMYDQRMNFVSKSVGNGALDIVAKKRSDGETEYLVESVKGPSPKSVVDILKGAKPMVGDTDAVSRLFTLYLAALRADRVGFNKLGLGQLVTEAELRSAVRDIENVPGLKAVFEEARKEYNTYNRNQVTFLEKTGSVSKDVADTLRSTNDYIPWYRAGKDGGVEFMLGDEGVFTVGNLKEKPYLHELVGDNRPIFDFLTSSVQNTNMIVDMGLNNLATKNAVFELVDIGAAKITGKMTGPDVVRFKDKGEDKYALIETDPFGVPAELLVKGLEGIPMQVTGMMRLASLPSKLLRKVVTLNPLYPAKQLFRDSLAAPIISGADFTPVFGALREIGSVNADVLEKRGIVGGQYFTGTQEDLSMILREVIDGKSSIATLIGKAEALGMEADALTRRAQYNSYIKQGMSEMEATLMALESMNFNKRGAASYMHTANSLIPFLNAQIQSLNVLYKALRGQMPLQDKLRVREKLLTRGMILMAGSLAYAALMEDDEAYKNALPDQKYGNWFIRLPGLEEPLRVPIPFEIGYVFKALPEALYNMIRTGDSDEAKAALEMIVRQVTPGGSSMPTMEIGGIRVPVPLPIPQFAKPALEVALGKSFYTGRDILSAKEQKLLPEAQYRETTTELAKMFGGMAGMSPVKLDALVNGYTSALGIAAVHLLGMGLSPNDTPERATRRWSETPIISGAFQPNDAGWAINRTYDLFKEDMQVQQTYKDYLARGEKAKAMELVQQRADQLALAEFGNTFEQTMRKFTQFETAIKASDKTPDEKRRLLDEVRQAKIRYAEMVRQQTKAAKEQVARTIPQ